MKKQEITIDNASIILEDINNAYYDIPFSNTAFQTEMFVIAAQITPARAYRSIGLTMQALIGSIKEMFITAEKEKIDIDEITEELQNKNLNKFEKRRKEIKLKELQSNEYSRNKRLNDTLHEINIYYKHYLSFPKYTREEFESQEHIYFEQSLHRQIIGIVGAKEAIINMTNDKKTIENFEKFYAQLDIKDREKILDLTIKSLEEPIYLQDKK